MLTAYIMARGFGERFWPLSTPEKPKQLLSLFSDKSMIRETVDRILPLIPAERIFIGTKPEYPETGYGYIQTEEVGKLSDTVDVVGFLECLSLRQLQS